MKMKNNIICMKKSISISNFVENFLLSIILDFENFPDTVCTIRIINYIRKFFVIPATVGKLTHILSCCGALNSGSFSEIRFIGFSSNLFQSINSNFNIYCTDKLDFFYLAIRVQAIFREIFLIFSQNFRLLFASVRKKTFLRKMRKELIF